MAEETPIEKHVLKFINKIAEEQNFKSFNTKITPVSTSGVNFTSNLFKIKIHGQERDLNLFAKVSALSEKVRVDSKLDLFRIEKEFYTTLARRFRELEEKNSLADEDKLNLPEYYGTDMAYLQEILVLEDLGSKGFGSANRLESVDWSYASVAVTELAKFHALSIAFQHENPEDFEEFLKKIPVNLFEDNPNIHPLFNGGKACALAAVREDNKDKLELYFNNVDVTQSFNVLFTPVSCKVITHTDFRPSNLMHRVNTDGSTTVIPVDFQTIQPGSPVIDLIYFIVTATDGPFRAKYYQKLVDHYYSQLDRALARLGLDVAKEYSRKNFESELKEKLPLGLLTAIWLLPATTASADEAPGVGADFSGLVVSAPGDVYVHRLNDIVQDYINWEVLN